MAHGNFPRGAGLGCMSDTPAISLLRPLPKATLFCVNPEQLREAAERLAEPVARVFGAHLFFEHTKTIACAVRNHAEVEIDFNALLDQLNSYQRVGYLLAGRWWSEIHVAGVNFDGHGHGLFEDLEHG